MPREDRYWELYDDQTSADFDELSYVDLGGKTVYAATEDDIAAQVFEIRRRVGADTEIRVYARQNAPTMALA